MNFDLSYNLLPNGKPNTMNDTKKLSLTEQELVELIIQEFLVLAMII